MKFKIKLKKFILSTMNIIHSAFFIILICTSIILLSAGASAQSNSFNTAGKYQILPGKLSLQNSISNDMAADTIKNKSSQKVNFKMKKSPWRAVAYSAVLPGAGQFYNESYWKIPVIAGLGGYFVYEWIQNNNLYLDYKEMYANSQTPQNPSGNLQLQGLREFYRDQRDNFIIYSLILYVVNLLDAYVDAQLFDFDVSENIQLGLDKTDKVFKLGIGF